MPACTFPTIVQGVPARDLCAEGTRMDTLRVVHTRGSTGTPNYRAPDACGVRRVNHLRGSQRRTAGFAGGRAGKSS
ncbi:MAG: hypothetical protein ABIZ80_26325 [Bryobacteraceae bacterium]